LTTNKQKKSALITIDQKNLISSKLDKNTLKITNQTALEMKSNFIILTPTIASTCSIESCVNKLIGIKEILKIIATVALMMIQTVTMKSLIM